MIAKLVTAAFKTNKTLAVASLALKNGGLIRAEIRAVQ